jgi:hypothetical protein
MQEMNETSRTDYDRIQKLERQAEAAAMGALIGANRGGSGVSAEGQRRIERQRVLGKTVETALGSLNRIHEAIQLSITEEVGPLLKSDLDNATKHANQVAKQLRIIKKALFPQAEKVETPTPTPEQ